MLTFLLFFFLFVPLSHPWDASQIIHLLGIPLGSQKTTYTMISATEPVMGEKAGGVEDWTHTLASTAAACLSPLGLGEVGEGGDQKESCAYLPPQK